MSSSNLRLSLDAFPVAVVRSGKRFEFERNEGRGTKRLRGYHLSLRPSKHTDTIDIGDAAQTEKESTDAPQGSSRTSGKLKIGFFVLELGRSFSLSN